MKRGYIHLYTGNGKGKTTAAIGLALRARGQGLRVLLITFHKNALPEAGEYRLLRQMGIAVRPQACFHPRMHTSRRRHGDKDKNKDVLRKECLCALQSIRGLFGRNQYDMIVLDEIIISVRDGFLQEAELLALLNDKPRRLELVLTGRGAGRRVRERADLITEMRQIKHPYERRTRARKGIEY